MGNLLRFLRILFSFLLPVVASFIPEHYHRCHGMISVCGHRHFVATKPLFSTDRDKEIADLEAKLAELKTSELEAKIPEQKDSTPSNAPPGDLKYETNPGKEMIMSESELIDMVEEEYGKSEGINLFTAIPALAVGAAALFFFAQIPIGQEDLSKYSVTESSVVNKIDLGDLNPDVPQKKAEADPSDL